MPGRATTAFCHRGLATIEPLEKMPIAGTSRDRRTLPEFQLTE